MPLTDEDDAAGQVKAIDTPSRGPIKPEPDEVEQEEEN